MNLSALRSHVTHRLDNTPAWVTVVTLFIGMGWLRAGVEKLLDGQWWNGSYLTDFLAENDGVGLGVYHRFADLLIEPNAVAISLVVMLAQFAIGAALITGRATRLALAAGIGLNLHFIAAGAVDPSVFYILSQGAVLLWMAEQSRSRITNARLDVAGAAGLGLAAFAAPSVTTIDPAEVIHDPGMILVTIGMLTATGAWLSVRHRKQNARRSMALAGSFAEPHPTPSQSQLLQPPQ